MRIFGRQEVEKEKAPVVTSGRAAAHARIFYAQIGFTILTFALGARALLSTHIPFFSWLPALLLLFDSTLAFASLLYLDFSRRNTISYLRLVLSLVLLRISCSVILVGELFLPHSDPTVSVPLIIVSVVHSVFSLLCAVQVHSLTYASRDKVSEEEEDGMKMQPCLGSTTTLVTNVDDDFIAELI